MRINGACPHGLSGGCPQCDGAQQKGTTAGSGDGLDIRALLERLLSQQTSGDALSQQPQMMTE